MSAPATPSTFAVIAGRVPRDQGFAYATAKMEVRLGWAHVATALQYRVQTSSDGFATTLTSVLVSASGASVGDPLSLDLATSHVSHPTEAETVATRFRVRAENGDGNSAYTTAPSFSGTGRVVGGVTATPSNFAAATVGAEEVTFTWDADPEYGRASYEIGITPAGGSETVYAVGGLEISFAVATIGDTDYSARIRTLSEDRVGVDWVSDWSDPVTFLTAGEGTVVTFPVEIEASVGVYFNRSGTLTFGSSSALATGLPPGLTVALDDIVTSLFAVEGIPTAAGLYDVRLQFQDGSGAPHDHDVRMLVNGGGFIGAFHAGAGRCDFVLDWRTNAVGSYYATEAGLPLQLGSDIDAWLLLADSARWLAGVTELTLTLFAADNFNAPPLLEVTAYDPTATAFGRATGFPFPFRLDSPVLREVLAALNAPSAGAPATAALACSAQLSVTRDGALRRSRPFTILVRQ